MKSPFLWLTLSLLSGVLFHESRIFHLPTFFAILAVFVLLPTLLCLRGTKYFLIPFFITASILGFVHTQQYERAPKNSIEKFTGQSGRISLEGIVISDPEIKRKGKKETISFILKSRNLMRLKDKKNEFFKTQGKVQVFLFGSSTIPSYGDVVRMKGFLEFPKRVHNPGEFDYSKYLRHQKICCLFKGYGAYSLKVRGLDSFRKLWRPIHKVRLHFERRIEELFSPKDSSILKAVLLGRKKAISPEVRDDFVKTGTAHLLAISGLHMAIIAGSFYLLLLACGASQRGAALSSILFIFFYIVLAGAGFPVRRAGQMTSIAFLGVLFDRERSNLNSFFFAFFLILFLDPKALMSLSFQLSFISVFSMMLLLRSFHEEWKWSETLMRTTAVIVGTCPLILLHFNVFSLTNFIANLVAIPIFHLTLIGGLFSLVLEGIPGVGGVCVFFTHYVLAGVLFWIKSLASLEWGYFFVRSPSVELMAGYYLSLGIFIWSRKLTLKVKPFLRLLGVSGVILFGTLFFIPPQSEGFSLTALYQGKNEVFYFKFPGKTHWVLNTGRSVRWTLEPYLKSQGIKHLSGIFLTGNFSKYGVGLPHITRNFIVDYVFVPLSKKGFPDKYLSKRINKAYLHESEVIRTGDDGFVKVVATSGGRAIYLIGSEGWHFLSLPSVHPDMLLKLQERKSELSEVRVLLLPAMSAFSENRMNQVMEVLDPHVVTIPNEVREAQQYFDGRDIALFDLKNYGAVTFEVGVDGVLKVTSFLRGEVGAWNANEQG